MTQKEIDKFLANTKVYVNGQSEKIQEKLFKLDYYWGGNYISNYIINKSQPFIYINNNKRITCGANMESFINSNYKEITAEEILSLELTEPTYRPFKDKDECWKEMLKHEPFGWIKHINSQIYENCGYVGKDGIDVSSYENVYKHYTFADDTPFGIKED